MTAQKPLWRRKTAHNGVNLKPIYIPHIRGTKRLKPNETLRASLADLGKHASEFELVENGTGVFQVDVPNEVKEVQPTLKPETKEETQETVQKVDKEGYQLVHKGAGWYDIESTAGKVMNEKKLRKEEAEKFKNELEGETIEE